MTKYRVEFEVDEISCCNNCGFSLITSGYVDGYACLVNGWTSEKEVDAKPNMEDIFKNCPLEKIDEKPKGGSCTSCWYVYESEYTNMRKCDNPNSSGINGNANNDCEYWESRF